VINCKCLNVKLSWKPCIRTLCYVHRKTRNVALLLEQRRTVNCVSTDCCIPLVTTRILLPVGMSAWERSTKGHTAQKDHHKEQHGGINEELQELSSVCVLHCCILGAVNVGYDCIVTGVNAPLLRER
jgi:hypothetical protein